MASSFINPEKLSKNALGILLREIVVPGTVSVYAGDQFKYAKDHTITMPIRARATARRHKIDATGGARTIVVDDLNESSLDVKLTEVIYHATSLTQEQLTLDVDNFTERVLQPQALAVVEDCEELVYSAITDAPYHANHVVTWDLSDSTAYRTISTARKILNKANVPGGDRILLVGPEAEFQILNDKNLDTTNPHGLGEAGLRDAFVGRIANFNIYTSNLVEDDAAYAYHRSAFGFANVAPVVPNGAKAGKTASQEGFSLTWVFDYDSGVSTDRSVVNTYAGIASVNDGPTAVPAYLGGVANDSGDPFAAQKTNCRAVKIKLQA